MKPYIKFTFILLMATVGAMINQNLYAGSKQVDNTNVKESVEVEDVLTYGITNVDEDEIYIEVKYYLNDDSHHFNCRLERPDEIPYIKFIPKHDIVWHYFVKSIPTSFLKSDESLHILEIL